MWLITQRTVIQLDFISFDLVLQTILLKELDDLMLVYDIMLGCRIRTLLHLFSRISTSFIMMINLLLVGLSSHHALFLLMSTQHLPVVVVDVAERPVVNHS